MLAAGEPPRVIAVVGVKGGVGATLVAVGLAGELAEGRNPCVVDLDLYKGDVAGLLDLEIPRPLATVVEMLGDLDGDGLRACAARHESGVAVIGQPDALDEAGRDAGHVHRAGGSCSGAGSRTPAAFADGCAVRQRRKGGVAVQVAVTLLALLAFVALVIDLGYVRVVHAQLQAAADAAALGGASRLDGSTGGLDDARLTAVHVGALNHANGEPVALDSNAGNQPDGAVVLGQWDAALATFTPSLNPNTVNAVKVRASAGDLAALFAQVAFGRDHLAAAALSIAWSGGTQGAGSVPYYLPFGLPSCLWEAHEGEALMDMEFVLSPAGEDNTGWATVGGSPNAQWVAEHLTSMMPCMHEYYETGHVDEDCTSADMTDPVGLNNGVAASALQHVADAVEAGVPWNPAVWGPLPEQHPGSAIDPDAYGNVLEGPIPVFVGGPSYCGPSGSWNETLPMLGFVWAAIYDVRTRGSATNKNLWMRIDLSTLRTVGTGGGGEDYGVVAPSPAVVVR